MQLVVVSSPGPGRAPHWSHEVAAGVARLAAVRGVEVRWLAALHAHDPAPSGGEGVQLLTFRERRVPSLHQVAVSQLDAKLELALTESLRTAPGATVLHVGLGAHGSPNVLWIADRLGSPAFAVARSGELVCHRGDLLDRDKRICAQWDDADRCRWCCTTSWLRRPRADDLRNRADLLVAGLNTCRALLVPDEADVPFVAGLGVPTSRVAVGASAEQVADRVLAG